MPNTKRFYMFRMRNAAQKMKSFIKGFSSKCDQIRSFLKKSLMEDFTICAVKRSILIGITWIYLGPCQTTIMTFFAKQINR